MGLKYQRMGKLRVVVQSGILKFRGGVDQLITGLINVTKEPVCEYTVNDGEKLSVFYQVTQFQRMFSCFQLKETPNFTGKFNTRVFPQIDKIDNSGNIGIRGFTT